MTDRAREAAERIEGRGINLFNADELERRIEATAQIIREELANMKQEFMQIALHAEETCDPKTSLKQIAELARKMADYKVDLPSQGGSGEPGRVAGAVEKSAASDVNFVQTGEVLEGPSCHHCGATMTRYYHCNSCDEDTRPTSVKSAVSEQAVEKSAASQHAAPQIRGYENAIAIIRLELDLPEDSQEIVGAIRKLKMPAAESETVRLLRELRDSCDGGFSAEGLTRHRAAKEATDRFLVEMDNPKNNKKE